MDLTMRGVKVRFPFLQTSQTTVSNWYLKTMVPEPMILPLNICSNRFTPPNEEMEEQG